MRIFTKLMARINGGFAVKVRDNFHVYAVGEVTLERLQEIFPGLPIYRKFEGGWIKAN